MQSMTIIGMTGTRKGMTASQVDACKLLVAEHTSSYYLAIHGCCAGADTDFHRICRDLGATDIEGYPGDAGQRAWGILMCQVVHTTMPYHKRNLIMAKRADVFFAFPGKEHEELHSGTWMTIRMRRKLKKPMTIVYPSGRQEVTT